jgi:mono/diheme cytochrome c family protein
MTPSRGRFPARTPAVVSRTCLAVVATCVAAAFAVSCSSRQLQPVTGENTFDVHCVPCHGRLGEGDGPDAASRDLVVPSLRTLARRNGGVFPADAVAGYIDGTDMPAAHGDRNMPVWGPVFETTSQLLVGAEPARERIDAVIEHLRKLQVE